MLAVPERENRKKEERKSMKNSRMFPQTRGHVTKLKGPVQCPEKWIENRPI